LNSRSLLSSTRNDPDESERNKGDCESDSSDTEGPDISGTDEHFVTSLQSPDQTKDRSKVWTATDSSSTRGETTLLSTSHVQSRETTIRVQSALSTALSQHKMKLAEDIVEGFGERDEVEESAAQSVNPADTAESKLSDGELSDVEDNETESNQQQSGSAEAQTLSTKQARICDPDLPDTVQVLFSQTGTKVYLIGTAHFSKESCEDVSRIIQAVQPDIVMVELCKQRTNILHLDEETILEEAQNLSMERSLEIIRQQGTLQGVMYLLLLSMSAHITKELGMAPGGEFRRAYIEAQKVPRCMVHLGDRPIGITLQRALSKLSVWQKIRLGFNILTSKDTITIEEVEKCKQMDLLENMLAEMAGEFPALSEVFVAERDLFLSHSLQLSADSIHSYCSSATPRVVVGVVGIGHVPGIVKNWGKVTKEQIREIVTVDPPSKLEKVVKFTVKAAMIGTCCYGFYRIAKIPVSRFLLAR